MKISRVLFAPLALSISVVIYWILIVLSPSPEAVDTFSLFVFILAFGIGIMATILYGVSYVQHTDFPQYFWKYDLEWIITRHIISWGSVLMSVGFLWVLYIVMVSDPIRFFIQSILTGWLYAALIQSIVGTQDTSRVSIASRTQNILSLRSLDRLWGIASQMYPTLYSRGTIDLWKKGIKQALIQQDSAKVSWYYNTLLEWIYKHQDPKDIILEIVRFGSPVYRYDVSIAERRAFIKNIQMLSFSFLPDNQAWKLWSQWYYRLPHPQRRVYLETFWDEFVVERVSFQSFPILWKLDALSDQERVPYLELLQESIVNNRITNTHLQQIIRHTSGTIRSEVVYDIMMWKASNQGFQRWFHWYINGDLQIQEYLRSEFSQSSHIISEEHTDLFICSTIQTSVSQTKVILVWLQTLLFQYTPGSFQYNSIQRWIIIWQKMESTLKK